MFILIVIVDSFVDWLLVLLYRCYCKGCYIVIADSVIVFLAVVVARFDVVVVVVVVIFTQETT